MTTLLTRSIAALAFCAALGAATVAQPPAGAKGAADPAKDVKKGTPPASPKDVKKDAPPVNPPKDVKKDVAPPKPDLTVQVKAFDIKVLHPAQVEQALNKQFATAVASKVGGPAPAPVAVASDPRTRTVFVRGTAAEIEAAARLIAQIDAGVVLPLNGATVDEVMRVLTALELAAKVHADAQAKTITVFASDPNAEQIKLVVGRLSGAGAAPAPAPKKN